MASVLSKDAESSEFHMDLSLYEKRLVRAAVKTYNTGTYLSLKLFKRDSEQVDWDFNQTITLLAREFRLLCQNTEKVKQMQRRLIVSNMFHDIHHYLQVITLL